MVVRIIDSYTILTIERHILESQTQHPYATGVLTQLLYDIALAGKVISSRTTKAGLAEILGKTGEVNIQGEVVQKLDQFANLTMFRINDHTGRLAIMASEENEQPLAIPNEFPTGKYVLLFDPLDGSSNIDFNIPVGTIFSIYRRLTPDFGARQPDRLPAAWPRPGCQRVYHLWFEHDAGVLNRSRRSRLHPGSFGW